MDKQAGQTPAVRVVSRDITKAAAWCPHRASAVALELIERIDTALVPNLARPPAFAEHTPSSADAGKKDTQASAAWMAYTLVAAGNRGSVNFAPDILRMSGGDISRLMEVSTKRQILTFRTQRLIEDG